MLTLKEFLSYWIPKIYQINPGQRGFRKASIILLNYITEVPKDTITNWIDKRPDRNTPKYIIKLINEIHIRWLVEEELNKSSPNLEKIKELIGDSLNSFLISPTRSYFNLKMPESQNDP